MPVQTTYNFPSARAFAGMLVDSGNADVKTMRNDEVSAEIPFGTAVIFGSATDEDSAKLPSAETDAVAGIVLHDYNYQPGIDLGDTGVKPGVTINVLRKGRVWVVARKGAVVLGVSRLWVRAVAGGGEFLGACEDADDSTDTIDCTNQGVFMSSGAADALVMLEVDFTNDAT
jgi:hypothetical protein